MVPCCRHAAAAGGLCVAGPAALLTTTNEHLLINRLCLRWPRSVITWSTGLSLMGDTPNYHAIVGIERSEKSDNHMRME